MKDLKLKWLLALAAGAAALLRWGFLLLAVDEKGLLVRNHPLELAFWAVLAASAALIWAHARKQEGSGRFEDNFTASDFSGIGHVLLASAILSLLRGGAASGRIGLLRTVFGCLAAPALIWAGICCRKGKTPSFLSYVAACLFFLLHLISRYQVWSGNPQMMEYVPELLALVSLVLLSYHMASFALDQGNRRICLALGLLTPVLCASALVGAENTLLYLAGGVWAASSLCEGKGETPHEAA